jgi:hypothetical protein
MIMARRALEPQGRWDEFLAAYRAVTHRWNEADDDGSAAIPAAYLLVTGTRRA